MYKFLKYLYFGFLGLLLGFIVYQIGISAPIKDKESKLLNATVQYITDGDTITTKEFGNIRLQCVDTPELHFHNKFQRCTNTQENAGLLAKRYLESLLKVGDGVQLDCKGKSYNRMVCDIYSNGLNINNTIIENGYGYIISRYCTKEQKEMFQNVLKSKKGLFGFCDFQEPCKFRGKC